MMPSTDQRYDFASSGEMKIPAVPTAQRFSSTDDNLWRPTRRAKEHYTKDKLSTRRGAVHSIGWLSRPHDGRSCATADSERRREVVNLVGVAVLVLVGRIRFAGPRNPLGTFAAA